MAFIPAKTKFHLVCWPLTMHVEASKTVGWKFNTSES